MLKQAITLWKKEKSKKETTLYRRLIIFFISISVFLILAFTLLLGIFGITGKEQKTIQNHINTELSNVSNAITDNFGQLSLGGIIMAKDISRQCDNFFLSNNINASELKQHPEMLESLLSEQAYTLMNTINNYYCGGVFIMLDATVNTNKTNDETSKAGMFIKKTQPTSTQAVGVKLHYLRGPAQIARKNGITLLGQWHMEYDISEQDFFIKVMENARDNPNLTISRLYCWSGRLTLKGNSESGFLLGVPLRSIDGTVFGVCGIEISDRLFKSLYSPEGGIYENIFTIMSPSDNNKLYASQGIIAGNYYLTGNRWNVDLYRQDNKDNFEYYSTNNETYGGKSTKINLYPNDSPYENDTWTVALLMDKKLLAEAIKGNVSYFMYTVLILLIFSLIISVFISRHYLRPVTEAFNSIRNLSHEERKVAPYLEINDLFDFLAEKDREYEEELRQKEQHNQYMQDEVARTQGEYEKAQLELSRLAYSRKQEVDPDLYQQFLDNLSMLTPTERIIFDLYVSGKSAKEILEIMCIKENTLKYHNKNIYSKLGVTSRKELLRYATLMNR